MNSYLRLSTILIVLLTACATPQVVLDLSDKTIQVNEEYYDSLNKYFKLIEKFVENQITVSELLIKEIDKDITEKLKKKAKLQLKASDANIDNILNELENNIANDAKETGQSIAKLKKAHEDMLAKHKELLNLHLNIIEAQNKLGEYLKVEKIDEAITNELLATLKVQGDNITAIVDDIAQKYDVINNTLDQITK